MKKLWIWLLAAALLITGCAVQGNTARAAGNGEPEERVCGDFTYTLNDSGEAVITGYSGNDPELTVPEKVDEYPVTEIGARAFYWRYKLTTVTLPEGLQSIESDAFSLCSSLTAVTLPEGLQSIGDSAFSGCSSLTAVTLPDSLKAMGDNPFTGTQAELSLSPDHPRFVLVDGMLIDKGLKRLVCYPYGSRAETCVVPEGILHIGNRAFSWCDSLTGITLPEGLQSIGDEVFSFCDSLTGITLPKGLQSIGDYAFFSCDSLTSMTLPEGLQSIGVGAFSSCNNLTGMTLPDSVETMGDNPFVRTKAELRLSPDHPRFALVDGMLIDKSSKRLVCYPYGSRTETCVVPEGILHIGNRAFSWCDSLTGITLPKGLQSIGDGAFSSCNNLTSLNIPASVITIRSDAFDNCPLLTLTVAPNSIGAAYANDNQIPVATSGEPEERVSGDFTYTLNDSGEAVITGYSGYYRELTVPDKVDGYPVVEIGAEAFYYRDSLIGVSLPEGMQRIGDSAFSRCKSLTGITLPEGLQSIGDGAFYSCESLTGITLPDSLKTMGDNPFVYTKAELLLSPDHPRFALVDGMLIDKGEKRLVRYPYGSSAETCVVPEGILQIGNNAFYDCSSLTAVTLPEGLQSIGDRAFYKCKSLTGITLPEGLQSIGDRAFYNCSSLTAVTLPEGLQSIGKEAFSDCGSLTAVTLPEGLQSIGDRAFCNCLRLTGLTLPEGLQSIGDSAFCNCRLTGLTLPDSLEIIMGSNPFFHTNAKLSLSPDHPYFTLVDGMLIDKSSRRLVCYSYGDLAETCVVPEGLQSIGDRAFSGCDSLTGITLPEGLQSIGYNAFSYCNNLTSLNIPASVITIRSDAFDVCPSLTLTVVPDSFGATFAERRAIIPFVYAE
ncbi:MAG: leucine-rich repeat domain-containing protein [Christensenellales bacterium]